MSDSEDEFKPRQKHSTKDQQIYGIFTQAYSKPSFGRGQKRTPTPFDENRRVSFKSGQKIETYSDKIEITLCEGSKKQSQNPKEMKSQSPILIEEEPEGQQIFTLESLMNTLSQNQRRNQIQEIQEKVIQKGFTDNTKEILKLRKFQKQVLNEADYSLPTQFGKKREPLHTLKSAEQLQKEQEYSQRYGVGYKILSKIGFNVTKGLGKNEDGIMNPVESVSKQAFIAEDDQQVMEEEQDKLGEEIEEDTKDKNILELFQYFSEDPSINAVLKQLKQKYQSLSLSLEIQAEEIETFRSQLEIEGSHCLQREQQYKEELRKREQHKELQEDISSHPHLALKFDLDLLIVQDTIKSIKHRKLESLRDFEFSFKQIKEMGRKLQLIYLQKQRENLRQFTSIGLKSSGTLRFQDTISISEEDLKKISHLQSQVFESTIQPSFHRLLSGLDLENDKQSDMCIEILKGLGKIDRGLQQKYLSSHIYPMIDSYLVSFDPTKRLPHLVVFVWFPLVSLQRLSIKPFIQYLLSMEWSPDNNLMFQIVSPWKKHLDSKSWNLLVSFGIAPRLLLFLERFQIKATSQNSENLTRLKSFIRYSSLLRDLEIEAILEDRILPMIRYIYLELRESESEEKRSGWLRTWQSTIKKIVSSTNIQQFFTRLLIQDE